MPAQPRVLIVEDDAVTALMLQNVLSDMGCEICGLASTAPRAVALADYHRPDVALVDVRLAKGTDGLAAAKEMRDFLKLDVLLMTGWRLEDDGEGINLPLMQKPLDPTRVKDTVRQILERRKAPAIADA
ncbi:response regulator [Aerophototrophica crusticola]|uniref:Response regulator n=1 Tax=Aerophototrophica crusticola TaxID=1709002 RepID=A0A858R4W9_9PROT|nr:response regulator [Rhodospirillaceae bacterium B3]